MEADVNQYRSSTAFLVTITITITTISHTPHQNTCATSFPNIPAHNLLHQDYSRPASAWSTPHLSTTLSPTVAVMLLGVRLNWRATAALHNTNTSNHISTGLWSDF